MASQPSADAARRPCSPRLAMRGALSPLPTATTPGRARSAPSSPSQAATGARRAPGPGRPPPPSRPPAAAGGQHRDRRLGPGRGGHGGGRGGAGGGAGGRRWVSARWRSERCRPARGCPGRGRGAAGSAVEVDFLWQVKACASPGALSERCSLVCSSSWHRATFCPGNKEV